MFARITNLNIQFNTQSGFLSGATEHDLYNIAVKNGYCGSFSSFHTYSGAVIPINFGSDIGLSYTQAPGAQGNYQLQVNATIVNPNQTDTINYSLYVYVIYEGTATVTKSNFITQLGVVSAQDVLNAKTLPFTDWSDLHMQSAVYGGGFFGSVGNFFSKLADGVGKVNSVVPLLPLAKSLGSLVSGSGVVGGASDFDGSGLVGGGKKKRVMSKAAMRLLGSGLTVEDTDDVDERKEPLQVAKPVGRVGDSRKDLNFDQVRKILNR